MNFHYFFQCCHALAAAVGSKMRLQSLLSLEYCFLTVTSAMKTSLVGTGRVELRCMSWVLWFCRLFLNSKVYVSFLEYVISFWFCSIRLLASDISCIISKLSTTFACLTKPKSISLCACALALNFSSSVMLWSSSFWLRRVYSNSSAISMLQVSS